MDSFEMNGLLWGTQIVSPNSYELVDRLNILTIATTDPETQTVYLSSRLQGDMLMRVFLHELGHCALYSYNLIEEIHRMVYPEYWIDAEEALCNFIADYGFKIFSSAFKVLGYEAWKLVPEALDKWLA